MFWQPSPEVPASAPPKARTVTLREIPRKLTAEEKRWAKEDAEFELAIDKSMGAFIDKRFYSKVAGVSFKNDDGTSRQKILKTCRPRDILQLVRELDSKFDRHAVQVRTEKGQTVGHLNRSVARQVAEDFDNHGRTWIAIVRGIGNAVSDSTGKQLATKGMTICLVRLTEEYVKTHPAKPTS